MQIIFNVIIYMQEMLSSSIKVEKANYLVFQIIRYHYNSVRIIQFNNSPNSFNDALLLEKLNN